MPVQQRDKRPDDLMPLPTPPPPPPFPKDSSNHTSSPTSQITNNTSSRTTEKTPHDTKANDDDDEEFEFFHEFKRENVKGVIHLITAEIKNKGLDTEYLMIPFRPEQTNEKLLKFLNQIFPLGNGQPVNEKKQIKIISNTNVFTLFQSLKYIWCRLPNAEIVGWKAYLEFKYREQNLDYPQKAFLELMPQCLDSPNHASIVYDFFDLIVTLASNSKVNKMSARKISKMCAIWAFSGDMNQHFNGNNESQNYDFDYRKPLSSNVPNNSIQDGLNQWIPASDVMFHLLLSFLKSFVPEDLESSKLPRSLKSLLFNNEYPPKGSTIYKSETILTIPLVTLKTDKFSRKPWQLLERCNNLLDFEDHNSFEAREDYALLKSLFKKKNNVEGISKKMSQESRRLMKLMSTKHSTFQAGWTSRKCLENIHELKEHIEVTRIDIDDYFIWTWLSTLSYEQTSQKKQLFGRPIILEFEFDGFKKWVLFQEIDITIDYRINEMANNKKNKNTSSDTAALEPSEDLKNQPLQKPEKRNITPAYEKFQQEVSENSIKLADSPGMYHTVISKETIQKNSKKHNTNLHSLEQKISKWNPLHNLRKKSNSASSVDQSTSTIENPYPRKNESADSGNVYTNNIDSSFELPVIETDNFKIEFPDLNQVESKPTINNIDTYNNTPPSITHPAFTNTKNLPSSTSSSLSRRSPPAQIAEATIHEINGMMEQLMTNNHTPDSEAAAEEVFEKVTKFEQYRPSNFNESISNLNISQHSLVESLSIANQTPTELHPAHMKPLLTKDASYPQNNIQLQPERLGEPSSPQRNPPLRDSEHQNLPKESAQINTNNYFNALGPIPRPSANQSTQVQTNNTKSNLNYEDEQQSNNNTRSNYSSNPSLNRTTQPEPKATNTREQQSVSCPPTQSSPSQPHQMQNTYKLNTHASPEMSSQGYNSPSFHGQNHPNTQPQTQFYNNVNKQQSPLPPHSYPVDNSIAHGQSPMKPKLYMPASNSAGNMAPTVKPNPNPNNIPTNQSHNNIRPMYDNASPLQKNNMIPANFPMQRNQMPPIQQHNMPQHKANRGRSQVQNTGYSQYVHPMSPVRYNNEMPMAPPTMGYQGPSPQPAAPPQQQNYYNNGQVPVQGYYYNHMPQTSVPTQSGHGRAPNYGKGKQELYGIPIQNGPASKLHSGNMNKRQERKNLYDNIRNGNFGI
ncbi:Msb1p NDAI_0D02640 [Naumovozyma dairenensis CBS 421]|uniref:Meiotically up-regulated protein Msb1/Mug8 domain-containing protein n=1 Tax=Naumovozyma dairenensis (strain ATCC 10597 / BCRC 20456 / CBS 421 / NBRC 0211 / NRRL Y-12639) TaxID=1071378 RepID=G0W9W7_NAUDC|nr:hypothetical protein NDAI_0D02640 [Naumovozyma dairenensis CBS 421]CCD24578.1 hypothetical protein NDAI_0D02640 [Naumovozyma dairenensis CBS 421]